MIDREEATDATAAQILLVGSSIFAFFLVPAAVVMPPAWLIAIPGIFLWFFYYARARQRLRAFSPRWTWLLSAAFNLAGLGVCLARLIGSTNPLSGSSSRQERMTEFLVFLLLNAWFLLAVILSYKASKGTFPERSRTK